MELLTENTSLFWLCLVALFAFTELFFLHYRVIWFSVGATGGLLVSFFCEFFWIQISVAVVVSVLLLWFSRNWVRQVRCDDAMLEIMTESMEETDSLHREKTLERFLETYESSTPEPQVSVSDMDISSEETETVQEKRPYPLCLLDP